MLKSFRRSSTSQYTAYKSVILPGVTFRNCMMKSPSNELIPDSCYIRHGKEDMNEAMKDSSQRPRLFKWLYTLTWNRSQSWSISLLSTNCGFKVMISPWRCLAKGVQAKTPCMSKEYYAIYVIANFSSGVPLLIGIVYSKKKWSKHPITTS